jgi:hypothetical protein
MALDRFRKFLKNDSSPQADPSKEQAKKLLRTYLDEAFDNLGKEYNFNVYPEARENGRAILESDPSIQKAVLLVAVDEMTNPIKIPEASKLDNRKWAKKLGFKDPRNIDEWINNLDATTARDARWEIVCLISLIKYVLIRELLEHALAFQEKEMAFLLDYLCSAETLHPDMPLEDLKHFGGLPLRAIVQTIEDYEKDTGFSAELRPWVDELVKSLEESERPQPWAREVIRRLKNLFEPFPSLMLDKGDAWADRAMQDFQAMKPEEQNSWNQLLLHASSASAARPAKPSPKWLKPAQELMEPIGQKEFSARVRMWFPLVRERGNHRCTTSDENPVDINLHITEYNADMLKGIVWCCVGMDDSELGRSIGELARVCSQNIRGFGPRSIKVVNACLIALGSMPGEEPVILLSGLLHKVKHRTIQKQIEKTLNAVAKKRGISTHDLEEMAVASFGMEEPGLLRQPMGDYTALLRITDGNSTEIRWLKPDGKEQKSVPAEIKRDFPEELKELKKAGKDIQNLLPLHRHRLEASYLRDQRWDFSKWRELYLDHPLMATMVRRLIWQFEKGERTALGAWLDGHLVDINNAPVDWLDHDTQVSLWHPIGYDVDTVLQWREWLERHEIQQPFKQAHREVYILTDAERQTEIYSNRFAAHIIRQHQFGKLCQQRNWRFALRVIHDQPDSIPTLLLPEWNLAAEFWVDAIEGIDRGAESSEAGVYLIIMTEQVRFLDEAGEPVRLVDVPPLVFSEVLRDADLFVSVCSIGNDPEWEDRGPGGYWHNYSFGELSESAKTRKQVLERLVPRLKIAEQCSFTDRYLVVRGDLRTYKIHLRSGNILMGPTNQYLCIVRDQSSVFKAKYQEKLFLPFEGDEMLSLILSKAFLLADDKNIKDRTILGQIQSG